MRPMQLGCFELGNILRGSLVEFVVIVCIKCGPNHGCHFLYVILATVQTWKNLNIQPVMILLCISTTGRELASREQS